MNTEPAHFAALIAFLKKHYRVTPLEAAVESLRGGKNLPTRSVVITFDDGYRDNLENAYPVLCREEVAATVFLTTDFIGTDAGFWWHEVYARSAAAGSGDGSATDLIEQLRDQPQIRIRRAIEEMRPPDAAPLNGVSMLTWEDCSLMRPDIITFGAHTRTHPILPLLDQDCLASEITGSAQAIEECLGKPALCFAYPAGRLDARVRSAVIAVGFHAAVGYAGGLNGPGADLYNLKRLGMCSQFCTRPRGGFSEAMAAAEISGIWDLFRRRRRGHEVGTRA